MIKNYLRIAFRSMMQNKLFIFINVFGMGIAIATCMVAYLNWEFANTWDDDQVNASRIYRVQFHREFQGNHERYGMAPMPLANYIRQNFPEVKRTVRCMRSYSDIRIGDDVFGASMAYVDSGFFNLFSFELKYGTWADFRNKGKIFISDEVAMKYYKTEDAVGKPLTQIITNKEGQRVPREYEVGGVFKRKLSNSSFSRFSVYAPFDNFWDVNTDPEVSETSWKRWSHLLFLEIEDPASVPVITERLKEYVEPQNKVREDFQVTSYYLENFEGMMARNRELPRVDSDYLGGGLPKEAITVPAIMAGLLLLLACFNFTNTSIAISSRRLKEIGIRKVMGGLRQQLVFQFLGENLLLCFLGLMMGLLLAEWMVPAYDSMWPWLELSINYVENAGFLLFLVTLLGITALIAGGYPSFYITSFEPVSILKGKARFGGTNWFTRVLLFGQFFISLLGIIMGVAFYNNGIYQRNYDLGYSTHGVISTWVQTEGAFNTYRDALSSNPDIQLISGTRHHIATSFYNDPVKYESIVKEVDILDAGDNYMEVMDMKLLQGRGFEKNSETDRKESILVTEEFIRQYGWKDSAIGKRVVWMDTVQLFVIGVVKDVYARALWEPVKPLMIRYTSPDKYQQLVARIAPGKTTEANEFMEKKWKEVFPTSQYNAQKIENEMSETNEINDNVVKMFGFLGFFAALMTGIGLYTLVSLNIVRRMKEIGVRKVLGASVTNIARVINLEFVISLGIATMVGSAVGYFASNGLMDSIWEYYETLSTTSIVTSVLVMFFIAMVSVGYKTVSTAMLNPTKTLRDE